jgi:hypothetical protein
MVEKVIMEGNLSELTPAQRISYYHAVCESIGINPLTKPFDYLNLNGKLVLYANKSCAQQLVSKYHISMEIMSEGLIATGAQQTYRVTCRASRGGKQFVDAVGAVYMGGLSGEKFSNAIMKAHTKAHRRATLAIVGLGFLDETEIDSIPDAMKATVNHETGEMSGYVLGQIGQAAAAITSGLPVLPMGSMADVLGGDGDAPHPLLVTCPIHDEPWKQMSNSKGAWLSHPLGEKSEDKGWCNAGKVLSKLISDFCLAHPETHGVKPKVSGWSEEQKVDWLVVSEKELEDGEAEAPDAEAPVAGGFDALQLIGWLGEIGKTPEELREILGVGEGKLQEWMEDKGLNHLDVAVKAASEWGSISPFFSGLTILEPNSP